MLSTLGATHPKTTVAAVVPLEAASKCFNTVQNPMEVQMLVGCRLTLRSPTTIDPRGERRNSKSAALWTAVAQI